jgi:hypothetical protein
VALSVCVLLERVAGDTVVLCIVLPWTDLTPSSLVLQWRYILNVGLPSVLFVLRALLFDSTSAFAAAVLRSMTQGTFCLKVPTYVSEFMSCTIYIRLDTGCSVRVSKPVWCASFSAPVRPWGLPNLLYNGYGVIPGGKAAKAWHWPPTPI